jgi:hypothetical protein
VLIAARGRVARQVHHDPTAIFAGLTGSTLQPVVRLNHSD